MIVGMKKEVYEEVIIPADLILSALVKKLSIRILKKCGEESEYWELVDSGGNCFFICDDNQVTRSKGS